MTSTGHTPIDHTDRWASARREQGEETEVGKIGPTTATPTNRAADQVLVTPDRPDALIRSRKAIRRGPGHMMPRADRTLLCDARSYVFLNRRTDAPSRCDRATCVPDNRCPEHRIDVDPPSLGDILRSLAGGGR